MLLILCDCVMIFAEICRALASNDLRLSQPCVVPAISGCCALIGCWLAGHVTRGRSRDRAPRAAAECKCVIDRKRFVHLSPG